MRCVMHTWHPIKSGMEHLHLPDRHALAARAHDRHFWLTLLAVGAVVLLMALIAWLAASGSNVEVPDYIHRFNYYV